MTRWMTRLTMRWTWLAIGLAAGLAAACERKQAPPGPSCQVVTEHVYELTRKAYPGHGEMQMGNLKTDVARCEARKLTGAQRRCMVEARSVEALASCLPKEKADAKKPDVPVGTPAPSAAPGAAAGPAAPPAPAPAPQ